jgi:phosphoglucomutase
VDGNATMNPSATFAARPSCTEKVDKLSAESFKGQAHLDAIVAEAQRIVTGAVGLPAVIG